MKLIRCEMFVDWQVWGLGLFVHVDRTPGLCCWIGPVGFLLEVGQRD